MTTDALLRHSPALATSTTLQARLNSAAGKTAPLMRHAAIASLVQLLGERLSTVESVRQHHGRDASYHPCAPPDAVAFAQSTEEVSQIVKVCAHYKVPIIPFGSGTGLEGHVLALQGGVTIDLSLMNKILQVNSGDLDATVEAGVTHGELNKHLRDKNLFFSVDPGANATLGGMAATRASGTTAVRYGTMRENVLSLKVVLPDGRIIRTSRRARKSSAGYDLTRLFVGSEGTLGVFTEVTVRLQPIPAAISAAMCSFPTVGAAVSTVTQTIQAGIPVARMELADAVRMEAIIRYSKLDLPLAPVLWMEFHGTEDSVAEQAKMVQTIAGTYRRQQFLVGNRPERPSQTVAGTSRCLLCMESDAPRCGGLGDRCVRANIAAHRMHYRDTERPRLFFLKSGHPRACWGRQFPRRFLSPSERTEGDRRGAAVKRTPSPSRTSSRRHVQRRARYWLRQNRLSSRRTRRDDRRYAYNQEGDRPDNIMNPGKIFRN